jgi:hypothetical protein
MVYKRSLNRNTISWTKAAGAGQGPQDSREAFIV